MRFLNQYNSHSKRSLNRSWAGGFFPRPRHVLQKIRNLGQCCAACWGAILRNGYRGLRRQSVDAAFELFGLNCGLRARAESVSMLNDFDDTAVKGTKSKDSSGVYLQEPYLAAFSGRDYHAQPLKKCTVGLFCCSSRVFDMLQAVQIYAKMLKLEYSESVLQTRTKDVPWTWLRSISTTMLSSILAFRAPNSKTSCSKWWSLQPRQAAEHARKREDMTAVSTI